MVFYNSPLSIPPTSPQSFFAPLSKSPNFLTELCRCVYQARLCCALETTATQKTIAWRELDRVYSCTLGRTFRGLLSSEVEEFHIIEEVFFKETEFFLTTTYHDLVKLRLSRLRFDTLASDQQTKLRQAKLRTEIALFEVKQALVELRVQQACSLCAFLARICYALRAYDLEDDHRTIFVRNLNDKVRNLRLSINTERLWHRKILGLGCVSRKLHKD